MEETCRPTWTPARVTLAKENSWSPSESSSAPTISWIGSVYLTLKQWLARLQKIMNEYAVGSSAWYTTNGSMLERGILLMEALREDLAHLDARDRHEQLRCWELVQLACVGEAHMRHLMYRRETRWPGNYYRSAGP